MKKESHHARMEWNKKFWHGMEDDCTQKCEEAWRINAHTCEEAWQMNACTDATANHSSELVALIKFFIAKRVMWILAEKEREVLF